MAAAQECGIMAGQGIASNECLGVAEDDER